MFAICLSMLAAAAPESQEPGLLRTQEAAAKAAGGTAAADAARLARARLSHWAPQIRGQLDGKDDARTRDGEFRLAPLKENDLGASRGWSVGVVWDFSQVIFAREETQLALAHAHLARLRDQSAERAAALWLERMRAKRAKVDCLQLLQLTAELDALTAGLFHEVVEREEAACVSVSDKN